jgi:hypothetical protein
MELAMTDKEYITMMQGDRLSREWPGTFDRGPDRLLPKLAIAAFLGLGLAVIGSAGDVPTQEAAVEAVVTPFTAGPPSIVVEGREIRSLAAK